ncbi:uncharacterized protein BX663DRAFT_554298 [Cokeromyces recurvatus]|uniref:uncharacterized protein n=1 Tax=Cokeromyces recurvatus TaxID=90255 RepID=UPI002220A017|nr:uncharacterized protein BX663DRAFT_555264 [Cokeromyces recurvatus]XP_051380101.1 uncharacterized protein BX663DRAFT_554298 [Cokeromyces recurvatus]KAI7899173.1 hypothetical protein BX663DRAFT_555264 [Cokeromyces recurvatus]KAI7900116.1 hypothetical protein BX663DRAFT_554298 [Cokeromyces recurvatus]
MNNNELIDLTNTEENVKQFSTNYLLRDQIHNPFFNMNDTNHFLKNNLTDGNTNVIISHDTFDQPTTTSNIVEATSKEHIHNTVENPKPATMESLNSL